MIKFTCIAHLCLTSVSVNSREFDTPATQGVGLTNIAYRDTSSTIPPSLNDPLYYSSGTVISLFTVILVPVILIFVFRRKIF